MVDSAAPDSPLDAAASAAGSRATDAFKLLGNEVRLAILLALWEAYDPQDDGHPVSFSALQERVGVRDSGRFNYHVGRLEDRFIRKAETGYELRRSGLLLVQSIIAGTGIDEPAFDRTEIDATCSYCGARTAITYGNGFLYQVCTECPGAGASGAPHPAGTLLAWTFEPTGLAGRTAEEALTASTIKNYARIAMRFEGICPECSGRVDWSLDVCADHDPSADDVCPRCERNGPVLARETCNVCKSAGRGSPSIKVLFHPAVISFFYDRGVEIGFTGRTGFDDVLRTLELVESFDEELVSTDPARVRVTVARDGDELRLLLDEGMNVIDVSAHP